ncbi:hypothetical protein ACFKP6_06965 [Streptococcus uberis]|uniref:hypothetical protein n=1 Tax=Streptococcus uberis TaxID=1349 RepID=UPI0038D50FFF
MIKYSTEYHRSIGVGDTVTSLIYGQYRGLIGKVVSRSQFNYGYFKRLCVEFEGGYKAAIEQKHLVLWDDWLEDQGKL